jgi:hypothetical protein
VGRCACSPVGAAGVVVEVTCMIIPCLGKRQGFRGMTSSVAAKSVLNGFRCRGTQSSYRCAGVPVRHRAMDVSVLNQRIMNTSKPQSAKQRGGRSIHASERERSVKAGDDCDAPGLPGGLWGDDGILAPGHHFIRAGPWRAGSIQYGPGKRPCARAVVRGDALMLCRIRRDGVGFGGR